MAKKAPKGKGLTPIDKVGNAWLKYMYPDKNPRDAILLIEHRLNKLELLEEGMANQCEPRKLPTRVAILHEGAALTEGARNQAYGNPVVNMQHMARMLTAYFSNLINYTFTGEDAAQIMVIAKQSRTANRNVPWHRDNYTDAAVYTAMAGECAEEERPSRPDGKDY